MDDRGTRDQEMLREFLAGRDAPCPYCGYNLKGAEGPRCPECAAPLELGVKGDVPSSTWDVVAGMAIMLTALYFTYRAASQLVFAFGSGASGPTMAGFRASLLWEAIAELVVAVLAGSWCVAVLVLRNRRPRPAWARPTSAAAGILLGIFVSFAVFYGLRGLL